MSKSAAVHLCHDRFSAVVLDGTAKRWKMSAADAGEIAPPPESEKNDKGEKEKGENGTATAIAALSGALKKLGSPHDPVALALPSSGAVFRNMQLPFTGDDAIERVLKFESESQLHQFNIDDVIVEHVTVEEHKGATDLIVAAAPKRFLRSQIDVMDRAGYDPVIVDLDGLSLFNAIVASQAVPPAGSALVLHIGRAETLALLIVEGKLRVLRSMRMGLDSLAPPKAAADAKKNGEEAAAEGEDEEPVVVVEETNGADGSSAAGSSSAGSSADPNDGASAAVEGNAVEVALLAPEDRREDFLRRLAREAVRTVTAESRRPLDEVLVCGEGAALPGVNEALTAALNVAAREVDLLANVDGAPGDFAVRRRLPIAYGAALKAIGVDATKTDFRQEDLRFAKKLETIKVPLAALSCSIAFTLLLQNIYVFRQFGGRRDHLGQINTAAERVIREVPAGAQKAQKKMAEIAGKFANDEPTARLRLYSNRLDEEIRQLKDVYGAGGTSFLKPQSAWEASQRFFDFLKKNQDDFGAFVFDKYTVVTDTNNPTSSKVTIKLTLTFIGSGGDATTRSAMMRKRLKEQRWCVDAIEGTTTPGPDDQWITYDGFTVIVDLTRDAG